jgi:hypothetical protein
MYSELVLTYKDSIEAGKNIFVETDNYFTNAYFYSNKEIIPFVPPFIPGTIYSFDYLTDAKISETRKFIDRRPLILCTGMHQNSTSGTIIEGIDLITVPPRIRVDIIGKFYDQFYQQIESNYKSFESGGAILPVNLKKSILDNLLKNTGYATSLFGFKYKFIRNPRIISIKDWGKIPYISISSIEGLSLQTIYKEYQSKLI